MKCEFCTIHHPTEFWRGDHFFAIDSGSADFPCFIRLISCRHVKEMSELSQMERRELHALLDAIERTLISELNPDKVNYAQFGNMTPHLHWHVIARWHNDRYFPECPWGQPQKDELPIETQMRRTKTVNLLPHLKTALTLASKQHD